MVKKSSGRAAVGLRCVSCSSGPWPLSRPPSLLVERAEDGCSVRASRVGCPGDTGTLACRERAGSSSGLQSASRVGPGAGDGFSGGGWSMNGFLEVGSSIFLFPWGMARRTSRLWELLRLCPGSWCRSALRARPMSVATARTTINPPTF